jgi:methyltransferase (TIGR00027 family)
MGIGVDASIQDTAYLAAACRAAETAKTNPRIRDEYAALFVDEDGAAGARQRVLAAGGDEVVARTVLIDELLAAEIATGGPRLVVNLGAGFCARPYRLDLRGCALVAEFDAAAVLDVKERVLAPHRSSCPVRRTPVDVRDRERLADGLAATVREAGAASTVVISEGLTPYLSGPDLAALAATLAGVLGDAVWLTDVVSPSSAQAMATLAQQAGAPVRLYGVASLESFEDSGWSCVDYRILDVPRRSAVPAGAGRPIGSAGSSRQVVDGVLALRHRR